MNEAPAANTNASYPVASLYVGDIDKECTEAMLFDKFSRVGPVLSIRVCRDMVTRGSLGYAYVNFQQSADAEKALESLNFETVMGRAMRIMWSQRDPSIRRSGVGNVFIKNLDLGIDNKSMYDTFSAFGKILSCKIATYPNGQSRGHGFVHFETEKAALNAIEKVNGMLLNGRPVYVGKFASRTEREDERKKFKNLFIKNFGDQLDDDKLFQMFSVHGNITSHKVAVDEEGRSCGYGFVAFDSPESAEAAVQALNGEKLNDKILYVGRAQNKIQRQNDLNKKFARIKQELNNSTCGANLYIKNLDDSIDDEQLRAEFSEFGNITSAQVMMEDGRSRGFGFVCFKTPEEAAKAVANMNGKILVRKPLYVALAQRREDRKADLARQYMDQRVQKTRNPNVQNMYENNPTNNYFVPGMPSAAGAFTNRFFQPPVPLRLNSRWAQPATQLQLRPAQRFLQAHSFSGPNVVVPRPAHPYARFASPLMAHTRMTTGDAMEVRKEQGTASQDMKHTGSVAHTPKITLTPDQAIAKLQEYDMGQEGAMAGFKYTNTVRNQPNVSTPASHVNVPVRGENASAVLVPGKEPLTVSMLAQALPHEQKQMLGERLYPTVNKYCPALSGKITGMLLEMDNGDLLNMLDDYGSLKEKMDEALSVLQNHQGNLGNKVEA